MKINFILLIGTILLAGNAMLAQTIKVEPKTSLKIELGTTLDVTDGNLVLESDATGDASLIDLGAVTYSGGGNAEVQRYLTNSKWHLISSPVSGATSAMFAGDFLQYHTEGTNSYTDIASSSTPLSVMKGYALWSEAGVATTEVFSGTTNTGNKSYSFTKTNLPNDNDEGWNLIGNPYPSAINWDEVTIPAELGGAIWLFDPNLGLNGDYRYYINGGGVANTTTSYIPSGQGFFVRATGGAGTLTFNNSDRVHNAQLFYKNTLANQMLVLKATGNGITTQTAVRFDENATPVVDRLYDVTKIVSGSPDVPVVYTKCENQNMAINTLPSVAGNETVPLFFEAGTNGSYVFDAAEIESLNAAVPVFLEDVAMNYTQDLRTNPQYRFDYAAGTIKEFKVHFKDVTGIETLAKQRLACFISHDVLHVFLKGTEFNNLPNGSSIVVYNVNGQQLLSVPATQADNRIPFNGSQAVYLVKLTTSEGVFTSKVFNQ
jgi:hypothetical protein